jgi:hypothetical protein
MTWSPILGLLAGIGVLLYLRRRSVFSMSSREDFSLLVHPTANADVRADALRAALVRHGYEPELLRGDEGHDRVAPDALLSGLVVRVRDRRLPRGTVTLKMPPLPVSEPTWAAVDVKDTDRGAHEELALHLIYELGKLIPPLEYKRSFSTLSLEATDTIEPLLPDRPHGLR